MNLEEARFNMVQQQVRPWEVLDDQILNLMMTCPREKFVPKNYELLAFSDIDIPIGHNQFMLSPKVIGRILQALNLKGNEDILEIGSGSGYLTALLSTLARTVTSIEIAPELHKKASRVLTKLSVNNVQLMLGNAFSLLHLMESFDIIVVTGSMPSLPKQLMELNTISGKLFSFIGKDSLMQATLITRIQAESWVKNSLFETFVRPLHHSIPTKNFIF